MNAAVVKKTQDTLGKVIKKPPLTEKLLSKPPFRYLLDIISEVIRTTGFMKGLYEDSEMKSDSVKDKDSKIAFLQKAIDVVMLVSNEPLAAKPARIVAGHEPEKTNELLQAIAKCCLSKMCSEEAVRRVLSGEKSDLKMKPSTSRSQGKENKEGRERTAEKEEKKKITERSSSRDQKDPEQHKEQESRRKDGEREHHRDRTEQEHSKDKSRDREREKARAREKEKERERDKEKTREKDSHSHRDREKEKRKEREKERHREKDERKINDVRESEEVQQKSSPEESNSKSTKTLQAPSDVVENQQNESPARIPRPSSAKGQRRKPKIGGQDDSDSEGDGEAQPVQKPVPQENGDVSMPSVQSEMASSNRRTARPSSARPAPPRLKRQESYNDATQNERLSSAKGPPTVILDGKKLSEEDDDEDEQFLVAEAIQPPPEASEIHREELPELDGDEKHGGLVKKILETKKDFEITQSTPKSKEQNLVSEAARKKEREMVSREIERLRSSIQMVCRSSLPLGKIMDYIQEDMDAMQAELQTWKRENKEHAKALLQEQSATDRTVEPLKTELAELDLMIKDQQDKICAMRSNILRNEEKIQKMVTGINFSSRT